jgi:predicted RNA binding protein YcfA (HicA-like mRNA interferase family)
MASPFRCSTSFSPLEPLVAVKARRLYAALKRLGWREKRRSGSHRIFEREGWSDATLAFHDGDEVGPKMLGRDRAGTRLDAG